MKNVFLTLGLMLTVSASILAQASVNAKQQASSQQKITRSNGTQVQSGTQIAGELQSTLDVKKANVGDEVILKATRSVKQNGQVVIDKGSRLVGHVTTVQQKAKGNADSKIGILFDHVQNAGGGLTPITATIMSITQARANASYGDDTQADAYGSSSTRASTSSSSSGGGGLLGGVGNTVGGVVNTTAQTTGNVVNAVGQTTGSVVNSAGSTVGATTGSLKGLSISQSTDASAQGGSTLSLTGGNLKLEKGATFNLALSSSSSVKSN